MIVLSIFLYYLLLIIGGITCIPIARFLFGNFRDYGYPFAKVLFQLLLSFLVLNFSYWFGLPLGIFTTILCLVVMVIVNLAFFHSRQTKITRNELLIFAKEEILFAVLFAGMLLFRGANPQIEGIEKFMDFAIVNGLNRANSIPPQDVWYSGHEINYYYFGHLGVSLLNKLSGIDSSTFYNFYVATLFALAGTSAFSLMLQVSRRISVSMIFALVLIFGGNLDYFFNKVVLRSQNYFYAQARGLIPNTINEFPAYSFLISDLHAHILNIPYVLLFLALCFSIYSSKTNTFQKRWLFMPLVFGALGATNSWDWFIYLPVVGALILALYSRIHATKHSDVLKKSAIYLALIAGFSIMLYLPFYLHFSPPSEGIGITWPKNDLLAIFKMFGFFGVVILLFLISNMWTGFTKVNKFILFLLFFSLMLVLSVEVIFVKDIYFKLNPPFYRANTVFKVWYQAWILLSIVSAYGFSRALQTLDKAKYVIFGTAPILILLFFVLAYPVISVRYIIGTDYVYKGLDGSSYLLDKDIGAKSVIDWINNHIDAQPVLLQAPGRPYSMDSLVSSYTGLPTVIGWTEHELGWRGEWDPIATRMGEVERMYTSSSIIDVINLTKKHKIEYILIGKIEKEKYGENAGVVLRTLSDYVTGYGDTELLKLKQQ